MSSRITRAYFWSGLAKVLDVNRRLIITTGLDMGSIERQKPKEEEIAWLLVLIGRPRTDRTYDQMIKWETVETTKPLFL